MDGWLPALAFIPGFFAGSLCMSMTLHWIALFSSGWWRSPIDAPLPSTSGRVWARIFSIVRPVPWLILIGIPYGTYRLFTTPPALGWQWFFGGVAAAISVLLVASLLAIRRHRARAETMAASNAGDHNVA